jgi:hypothetical protein
MVQPILKVLMAGPSNRMTSGSLRVLASRMMPQVWHGGGGGFGIHRGEGAGLYRPSRLALKRSRALSNTALVSLASRHHGAHLQRQIAEQAARHAAFVSLAAFCQ